MSRATRRHEAGQMVVIVALMAVLIFAASAIAVDLSMNTYSQRTLQNVSDSAALAGAATLVNGTNGSPPTTSNQKTAIDQAFKAIGNNEPAFPANWDNGYTYTSFTAAGGLTGFYTTWTYQQFSITVSTPPQTPRSTSNVTPFNLEVDMTYTAHNSFAGILGQPTSNVASHSVAYHYGPPAPGTWALYAATLVGSGNNPQAIQGDVYVGEGFIPQSNGQSGICAYEMPNKTKGHVVYGSPQPPTNPPPKMPEPQMVTYGWTPDPAQPQMGCPNGGTIAQQQPIDSCPANASWNGSVGNGLCVQNTPPPVADQPQCPANGPCQSVPPSCDFNSSAAPGIYYIYPGTCASNNVTLDFLCPGNGNSVTGCANIPCVSLVLMGNGISVNLVNGVNTNKNAGSPPAYMSAYGSTGYNGTYPATGGTCSGYTGSGDTSPTGTANRAVIYSNFNDTINNSDTGCCTTYQLDGLVYLPNGSVNFTTNASALEINGEAVIGSWNVQSGNHPDPAVTWDPNNVSATPEVLHLVE